MANINGINPPAINDVDYVDKITNSFNAIDDHDHTSGKGVAIGTTALADDSVTAAKLADNSVSTNKIQGAAVTAAKLASGAVGADAILNGAIANAKIDAAAAIVYSKLNLTGGVVNADVNPSAAIAVSKLAALTASKALQSSVSGEIEPSTVTSIELGYVSGVTSAIQTQFTNTQPLDAELTAIAALSGTGLIAHTAAGTVAERTITGTANQITVSNGSGVAGNPTISIPSDPIISGTGAIQVPYGTTAQRHGSPANGMIRGNSDLTAFEVYVGGAWTTLAVGTVIAFRGTNSAATSVIAGGTTIPFTAINDTNSGWSVSAYTIPQTGYYTVCWGLQTAAGTLTTSERVVSRLEVGGAAHTQGYRTNGNGNTTSYTTHGAVTANFTAGNVLTIKAFSSTTIALSAQSTENFFTIIKEN